MVSTQIPITQLIGTGFVYVCKGSAYLTDYMWSSNVTCSNSCVSWTQCNARFMLHTSIRVASVHAAKVTSHHRTWPFAVVQCGEFSQSVHIGHVDGDGQRKLRNYAVDVGFR